MIITGGSTVGSKVEVFNIRTKKSCQLADLPGTGRNLHSLCGRLLCAGAFELRSCPRLNTLTGVFHLTAVTLKRERQEHWCWDLEGEDGPILLMGGFGDHTTELVGSDGSYSSYSFNLVDNTE